MKLQLHRVGLDGTDDRRLTDPAFNHTVDLVARRQVRSSTSPRRTTRRRSRAGRRRHGGKPIAELAKSDLSASWNRCGRRGRTRCSPILAADGKTPLYGSIEFPVELRSVEEVPGADAGVRRSGVGQQHADRDVPAPPSADRRIRLPRREPPLARLAGHGQADARRALPQARPDRDRRHGRRASRRSGTGRTSTRITSGSTARPMAATAR